MIQKKAEKTNPLFQVIFPAAGSDFFIPKTRPRQIIWAAARGGTLWQKDE